MIDGLKLRLTSCEIADHCKGRAAYHRKRADEKEAELPALKEAMARVQGHKNQAVAALNNMTKSNYHIDNDDPVESLERDIRDHRNKALVFDFFGTHLFAEDYTLQEADLKRLEILK